MKNMICLLLSVSLSLAFIPSGQAQSLFEAYSSFDRSMNRLGYALEEATIAGESPAAILDLLSQGVLDEAQAHWESLPLEKKIDLIRKAQEEIEALQLQSSKSRQSSLAFVGASGTSLLLALVLLKKGKAPGLTQTLHVSFLTSGLVLAVPAMVEMGRFKISRKKAEELKATLENLKAFYELEDEASELLAY
jgi:hypothetical protein